MIDPEKMRLFMQALKPDLPGLARQVFIENPQTAWRELPGKLQNYSNLLQQDIERRQAGQPIDPALLNKLLGMTGSFAPMGVTAYHGSPYLFRMFDPMKRGVGEGNQAYGVGAGYTAQERKVAEEYAQANRGRASAFSGEIDKLPAPIQMEVFRTLNRPDSFVKQAEIADITKRYPETSSLFETSKSYLYKGDIPDEIIPKFLDWDKPIKDQSKEVQKLAKQYKLDPEDLGGDLVGRVGKTVEGSQIMESAGIRGIKYLDANSRNAKYGSQNFIPFRPEDYKIQEINDIPIDEWIRKGLL